MGKKDHAKLCEERLLPLRMDQVACGGGCLFIGVFGWGPVLGVSRAAALGLLPYWAWVTFAAALNLSFWWLNR
jgi:tryptophan-rich sensory protein